MPLTPADVHNVAFSKPPIGKRGYNEDEVDAFLDLVEGELARLVEENNDLRQRMDELDQQLADERTRTSEPARNGSSAAPSPTERVSELVASPEQPAPRAHVPPPAPSAVTGSVPDHNLQAAKVLALAQEMADRLSSEAKSEADALTGSAKSSSERMVAEATASSQQMVADATAKSEQMVNDARSRSEQMTGDAKAKSEAALTDARTRAETMQRQAKEKAEALQADAERKHTELMSTINTQRTQLEKKIEELRTFEREYRTRLKSYLEAQLQELGQRGSAAPGDGVRAGASTGQPGFTASGFGARSEQGS